MRLACRVVYYSVASFVPTTSNTQYSVYTQVSEPEKVLTLTECMYPGQKVMQDLLHKREGQCSIQAKDVTREGLN